MVQGQPCAKCGETAPKMFAGHKYPLVREYYESGAIDATRMRSPSAIQPECPTCSNQEGGFLSRFSKQVKKLLGL
jgi:hypothetical protein